MLGGQGSERAPGGAGGVPGTAGDQGIDGRFPQVLLPGIIKDDVPSASWGGGRTGAVMTRLQGARGSPGIDPITVASCPWTRGHVW